MAMTQAFTVSRLTSIGLAGAGAVTAAIVQSSVPVTTTSDNVRDLVLTALAVLGTAMGGANMRAFALGFGAATVGSLIRRNILVG